MNAALTPTTPAYTIQPIVDGSYFVVAHSADGGPARVVATVQPDPDARAIAARFARSAEMQDLLAEWSFDSGNPAAPTLISRTHACLARLDGESAAPCALADIAPPAQQDDPMVAFGQLLTEAEQQIKRMHAAAGPCERRALVAMTFALGLMFPALGDAITQDCQAARRLEGLS